MVLTSSGFVLQTQGLKHGSDLVVCTLAAAGAMGAGNREGGYDGEKGGPTGKRLGRESGWVQRARMTKRGRKTCIVLLWLYLC